ncbi:restriction endonuclease subunit S [Limosilactobacillus sp. c10Ua_36]|uniref:restriction endonuclease subunit S n=1 Tax=Limosilactobacillus sp. c10Ua_36 TaxID=2775910 RepID=UPI002DD65DE7|nr:restriction endonuclease subunit S [Limosilactobacillus sp. c10Ua_36]MEC4741471.1 restriction endonuclease subunit S [Limosilactobacillus sp. c10Ua_36]
MDKKPKRMVPEVRFKGFTDDWEQRKLGEISNKISDRNKTDEKLPVLTNSAEYGIINQNKFFDKQIANKTDNYYIVKNNDFVYNPRISKLAPYGPVRRNLLSISGLMSPLYYVFRPHSVDFSYLEFYFKSSKWYKFMYQNGDSGARSDRFAIKDSIFCTMPIKLPSPKEQTLVGELLRGIEKLLSLQQRKLEQLKQLKKAMLRQLLASKELSPSIRFKNFTEAWEQRKLGDIGNVITGNTPSTKDKSNWTTDKNKGHIWITPTDINRKVLFDSERYLSDKGWLKARKIPKNSVLITSIASIGKNAINGIDAAFNQQINALILQNNNYYFVLSLMDKEKKRFEALAGQTATPIINKSTFSSFQLQIPSENEQNKIGNFFKKIDNLITLHQRETNILSNLKKFFLQNLFI